MLRQRVPRVSCMIHVTFVFIGCLNSYPVKTICVLVSWQQCNYMYNYPIELNLSYDIYSDLLLISRNDRSPYKNIRDPRQVDGWCYESLRAVMLILDDGKG